MVSVGFSPAGNSWVSREIDRRTGGLGFCHAFLVFHGVGLVFEAHSDFGVRFKSRGTFGETLVRLNLTTVQEQEMLTAACLLAGNGYDFNGVLHFEVSMVKQDASKQFCSEACVMVGQCAGLFAGMTPSDVSPNGLYKLLTVP
jgi:hypothetical protein